nr:MAG TPA: hypothetical protein [Caudoviricetes sp.]
MLRKTTLLQIDGNTLPEPTEAAEIKFTDVESEDSGKDETGVYHREILRFGVLSCTLTYSHLSNEECAYLFRLLENKSTFRFTCPISSDSRNVEQTVTRTCYCTDHGAALQRLKAGVWRDAKLQIQEC